ncbi:TrbM/KikA/MpfK family conjugal transfer protein, partial [Salmonella enterica]|uniref:TrbM/KikA/MpfK family conjugal transfer protein n=1 Tax=Salmonella enterica TaxID=28901 RepID=UPI0008706DDB
KAVGQGGGRECRSAEKDFFNIMKTKKGSIRWSKTFDARKAFLNQCSTADPAAISKIMSKFGKVKGKMIWKSKLLIY